MQRRGSLHLALGLGAHLALARDGPSQISFPTCSTMAMALRGSSFPRAPPRKARDTHYSTPLLDSPRRERAGR